MTDLLIIGAGPAGLTAGLFAAKKGLKVVIVEMKKDITNIKRACSSQLVLDEGYEGDTLKISNGKLLFTKNCFEVPYKGKLIPIIHNYMYSPKGHRVSFEYENLAPSAMKIDKGELLRGLLDECISVGVDIRFGTAAKSGVDNGDHVKVNLQDGTSTYEIEARKLIIAEGVNRKLTDIFGINKGYQCMGIPLTAMYTVEGAKDIPHNSWIQYYGDVYHPFMEIMIGESVESDDALEITVMGIGDNKPEIYFRKLINDSPLSPCLKNARIIKRMGCSCKNYLSISKPYAGNVIAIGDSAAHIEVINQGAMMCGFNAANAVIKELNEENGFEEYTAWWNDSFEFNCDEPMELLKLYGTLSIKRTLADDEIDYLFSVLENERQCGHFNQYEVPKNFWNAVLRHDDIIKSDNPKLYEKLANIRLYKQQGKF